MDSLPTRSRKGLAHNVMAHLPTTLTMPHTQNGSNTDRHKMVALMAVSVTFKQPLREGSGKTWMMMMWGSLKFLWLSHVGSTYYFIRDKSNISLFSPFNTIDQRSIYKKRRKKARKKSCDSVSIGLFISLINRTHGASLFGVCPDITTLVHWA